jgi:hypothetical protein
MMTSPTALISTIVSRGGAELLEPSDGAESGPELAEALEVRSAAPAASTGPSAEQAVVTTTTTATATSGSSRAENPVPRMCRMVDEAGVLLPGDVRHRRLLGHPRRAASTGRCGALTLVHPPV